MLMLFDSVIYYMSLPWRWHQKVSIFPKMVFKEVRKCAWISHPRGRLQLRRFSSNQVLNEAEIILGNIHVTHWLSSASSGLSLDMWGRFNQKILNRFMNRGYPRNPSACPQHIRLNTWPGKGDKKRTRWFRKGGLCKIGQPIGFSTGGWASLQELQQASNIYRATGKIKCIATIWQGNNADALVIGWISPIISSEAHRLCNVLGSVAMLSGKYSIERLNIETKQAWTLSALTFHTDLLGSIEKVGYSRLPGFHTAYPVHYKAVFSRDHFSGRYWSVPHGLSTSMEFHLV